MSFDHNQSKKLLFQKQYPGVFCEKGVLGNFSKFTGKHRR